MIGIPRSANRQAYPGGVLKEKVNAPGDRWPPAKVLNALFLVLANLFSHRYNSD
jgi:hypothetical protein